jgi:hypothetical protein
LHTPTPHPRKPPSLPLHSRASASPPSSTLLRRCRGLAHGEESRRGADIVTRGGGGEGGGRPWRGGRGAGGRGGCAGGAEEGALDHGGGRHARGPRPAPRRGELERCAEAHRPAALRQELPPPLDQPPPPQPQEGLLLPRRGDPHRPAPRAARQQVGAHGRACKHTTHPLRLRLIYCEFLM